MTAKEQTTSMPSPGHTLVLYDGVCGLCNRLVAFLLRHDRRGEFRFAPLQSTRGQALLIRHGLNPADLNSVVVISGFNGPDEQALTRSAAILASLHALGSIWKVAVVGKFLPFRLREALYDFVASHRYRMFGKLQECPLPDPKQRHKFLPEE